MKSTQKITNVTHLHAKRSSDVDMASVLRDVNAARAILRMVLLALVAEDNHSILHTDGAGASRWSPAIRIVHDRIINVRNASMENAELSQIDWPTAVALIFALDSALWEGYCTRATPLTNEEAEIAIEVIIESLDDMLRDCAGVGGAPNTK